MGAACGWPRALGGGESNGLEPLFAEAACGWREDDEAACGCVAEAACVWTKDDEAACGCFAEAACGWPEALAVACG